MAGLTPAAPVDDAVAPVSAIGFPLEGATVPLGVTVTISGTSSDDEGVVAGVEVSTDGGATWSTGQGGENWSFAWTPAAAGAATLLVRAVDDVGNLEAPDTPASPLSVVHVTVSGTAAADCPCTIWLPEVAVGGDGNDPNPIEIGVRFRSDEDGVVAGARFYKHPGATGTHVAHLWTNAGVLLATATYTDESASGWQEVAFSPPVAITAGTTYVVSTFLPDGHYAFSPSYFAGSGQDRPPLHALQNGVDGANGVYRYLSSGFPTDTFNATNYWVDVVFDTESGPDADPPVVIAISPGNGATAVAVTSPVRATFSEPIDPLTLDGTTVQLRDAGNAPVAAGVSYDAPTRVVTLTPAAGLLHSTTYTARLVGGATAPRIQDVAGNALAADLAWSFTTASAPPPPPDEGPGGPILVLTGAGNPIGRFLAEILRTEGLNQFTATDLSFLTPALLDQHDVVVLADTPVSAGAAAQLAAWVDAGGNLIAMRPDADLLALCGLAAAGGTLEDAYLRIDTASGPGAGLVDQAIQFHGAADLHTLAGATALATLHVDGTTPAPGSPPAVTLRAVGANGGQVVAFAYDLARSVVLTRQGNPAWAGQERDGIAPIRSDDLFYGAAAGDPQPDWVDLDRVAIPQADEQQRLLANLILATNLDRKPLPRFWYFPRGKKAVVLMTGDDHGNGGTVGRMNQYLALSPPGCSVPDWECVRSSSYIYPGTAITDAEAAAFEAAGFEIGTHVNTGCSDWTEATLDAFYAAQLDEVADQLPSIPPPVSNRTHCIAWSEWATQARVERAHGIRLDTNYYYWPGSWVANRPGFFTGSGMPMRFADVDGTMIDCYQAATQLTDESAQDLAFTIGALLDRATGPEGYYGVFTANMHTDNAASDGSDDIVGAALTRGVPVVSGRQLLAWLDGRNGSSFSGLDWTASTLTFSMTVDPQARNLQAMLPMLSAAGTLAALEHAGNPVAWTAQSIKGVDYAFFPAAAGAWEAMYAIDTTPPAISAVTATAHGDGTVTIGWTTGEAGDSRVDYGTDPDLLDEVESDPALVTTHSLVLAGLVPNTTYHFRVRSADALGNAAVEPASPAVPLSFTMPPPACFVDASGADFAQGTTDAGTAHAALADGEVILAPTAGSDFPGAALPASWFAAPWAAGGAATVTGGTLVLDGASAGTDASYGPGRSLEFVATFSGQANQHIGFGVDYNGPPWAMFSTATGGVLQARTDNAINTPLPGSWLGAAHRFRIDWLAGEVVYFIDGVEVARHAHAVGGPMRPLGSDLLPGGGTAVVDWLRLTPYAGAGTFLSRVFDGAGPTGWGTAAWTADTPAGTSVALAVRSGDTAAPDGSWTAFLPVPVSGGAVAMNARYVQYRAELATTDPGRTPVLHDVTLTCEPGSDGDPPVISNRAAAPDGGGTSATVSWDTDEPATSRVDYGTSPGTLGQSVSAGALVLAHDLALAGLQPATTYYYRVTSVDASANAATSPAPPDPPGSFTTPAAPCLVDASAGDFAAGDTAGGTHVAEHGDGEVTLAPALGSEFAGASLPPDWAAFSWTGGGSAAVSGGRLHVDGMRANSEPPPGFAAGRSIEFTATFAAVPFQHVGIGGGDDTGSGQIYNGAPWAMFSTGTAGTTVLARTWDGGAQQDFPVPGGAALLGAPHRYRIDWTAAGANYSVDGVPVVSHAATLPGPMRPAISDYDTGGAELAVDWIRVTPYAASGTFDSRVHDAGAAVTWVAMSWSASTPAGTTVSLLVRGGQDPDPNHASWTPFQPVAASGSEVGICARYLQYRAVLTTSDLAMTPVLDDVTVTCAPSVAPAAITDLASAPSPGPPDASGRRRIALTWSGPGGDGPVRVYRKGHGDHPTYRPGVGVAPDPPASPEQAELDGWVLTAVETSGGEDGPATRDYWYYVAFNTSACGTPSAVSNRTDGALAYVLGDFSDGAAACAGDNAVDGADLSLLGAHYGETISGPADPEACLDIGPTVGFSTRGRPLPDGVLEFEDLVLCALNFTATAPVPLIVAGTTAPPPLVPAAEDGLELRPPAWPAVGESFMVPVWARGSGSLHALRLELAYDRTAIEILGAEAGPLLAAQAARAVVLSPRPGRVDLALLGQAGGLVGEGEILRLHCRRIAEAAPALALARVEARDGANRPLAVVGTRPPATVVPGVTRLAPARPNPFRGTVALGYDLAQGGAVDLAIYSVDGRRVRTLEAGEREAGEHALAWDGRDDDGGAVSAGVYYVRLVTAAGRMMRTITYLR
jgi:hypothetical protein